MSNTKLIHVVADFPRPHPDQIAALRGVPTSHVCDALADPVATRTIALRPLDVVRRPSISVVGTALVARNAPGDVLATLAATHFVQPGDVVVAASGETDSCATGGEVIATVIRNAGGVAFITDGPMRDRQGVMNTKLPVWCRGFDPNPPTSNGPARIGGSAVLLGQTVRSGDLIVADDDGVVAIPLNRLDHLITQLDAVYEAERSMGKSVHRGPAGLLDLGRMVHAGRAHIEHREQDRSLPTRPSTDP